jgi:putative glycosyltransferase (TIGR04372 family)
MSRYFTDLTDAQWLAVRAAAFRDLPYSDRLRAVIDGLLYRERARCPWQLLPPDLPPPAVLREHAASWSADGTWERVRRVVYPPGEASHRKQGLSRKAVVEALANTTVGRSLLFPGRKLLHLAQHVRGWFDPTARLPGLCRATRARLEAGRYEDAARLGSELLTHDPGNLFALQFRATALHHLRRHAEACADFHALLSHPGLHPDVAADAHTCLAAGYLRLGDPRRAVAHAYWVELLRRSGPDVPWDRDDLAEHPDEFELLAGVHNDLAELAINTAGDFATAARLYRMREEVRAEYRDWLAAAPDDILFLSDDWVRNVGHIALLAVWPRMQQLGWGRWKRLVLLAPPAKTANQTLLGYLTPHYQVIRSSPPPPTVRHLTETLGLRLSCRLPLPDGTDPYLLEGVGVVQEEWDRQGRRPLLKLTPEDVTFGRRQLAALGVPDGAWFAALHVRSPGYHREGRTGFQAHRNADTRSYLPAVREIIRRGGWVVRLGDRTMDPLPAVPGLIDYARSRFKSERMDVFLCGAARFFVGVASGMSYVPACFGVPAALTNWVSNSLPMAGRHDLFVPKLIRRRSDGRVLTFDEWFARPVRDASYAGDFLIARGLEAVDNTPDELRELVAEMLDRLDGAAADTPDDEAYQAAFEALARAHGYRGVARIGRDFLRRHAGLLPAADAAEVKRHSACRHV